MGARCRHPRLADAACRAYGLALYLHPPVLRREFGREMRVTFRNRAEDVLNRGSLPILLLFIGHIAADWLRTFTFEEPETATLSLLGLGAGEDEACGSFDRSTFTASLFLATLGVVLLIAGWYGWLSMTAEIMSHHRAL